jgi:hypothetical protein
MGVVPGIDVSTLGHMCEHLTEVLDDPATLEASAPSEDLSGSGSSIRQNIHTTNASAGTVVSVVGDPIATWFQPNRRHDDGMHMHESTRNYDMDALIAKASRDINLLVPLDRQD